VIRQRLPQQLCGAALENFDLSELQIESFARILLPSIREYYKDPKHVQDANEWVKQQNKQSTDT
jgi:hypothetical protein